MSRFKTFFAVAIFAAVASTLSALVPSVAEGAVPSLVNFQGILKNGSGTPQVGTFSVTFTIYPVPAGGSVIWSEVQSVTTNAAGLFNVLLGSVTPITDVVFSGSDRYLSIAVSPDPEMTPRTRIATVAYAFRPATVDGATGGTISGDVTVSNGDVDLDNSIATSGNILKSGVPFIHNFGTDNTFIGVNAGNLTLTGNGNIASGASALQNTTTGSYNTASGFQALQNNTTGSRNTASGFQALQSNTTGEQNTASGWIALANNTTGTFNTANGVYALRWNTTGNDNTASGWGALLNNGTGYNNTAQGRGALLSNATGYANTASGFNALYSNTTGFNNTANGDQALQNNTTGAYNTASGTDALQGNTFGTENTASGWGALQNNSTGNNNTASGGQALQSNTTGSLNTACGVGALISNTTGDNNTAVGFGANVASGAFTNATAIGYNALVNASNKIRLGNGSVTVIEGQVAYTFTSDKNQKENFRPVDGDEVLRKIRALNLRSWNYIGNDPQQFRHYGPVAQEFFAAFGHDDVGTSGTPTTINSGDEAGIMMIAIQTLEKEKEAMKAENAELKARIEALENRMKKPAEEETAAE